MKIFNLVSTGLMSFGLAVYAGSYLFGAGSLTALGWIVMAPLFAGSAGHVVLTVINSIPKKEGKEAPATEKEGIKPTPQTAGANA